MPADHGRKARARLDRQLVQGKVLRSERKRLAEHCSPALLRVAGQRVDQVEAHPPEPLLRNFQGPEALAGGVGAAEKGERLVVEALEAERQAIDAARRQLGEA